MSDYELWLLDSAFDLPLALIASARQRSELSGDLPLRWRAGVNAEANFRVAPSLTQAIDGDNPAKRVAHIVNRAAGPHLRAQWFHRHADGSGRAIMNVNTRQVHAGRLLPSRAFPEQLLRSHWPDATAQALVRAYLDWQAPWLLMLQHLSDATRDRLERAAGQRAVLLADNHVLFPKILDRARIVAARVEARMRRAAGEGLNANAQEETLFPFFNE